MVIVPDSIASSRLIARHRVDLPEPDGPRTTTTSPLRTVRLIFWSTCSSPKYLSTSLSTTKGPPRWSGATDGPAVGSGMGSDCGSAWAGASSDEISDSVMGPTLDLLVDQKAHVRVEFRLQP